MMVALGTFIGAYFCQRLAAKRGIESEKIIDLIFWVVIFGLIGGRVFYVFLNLGYYIQQPLEIIKLYKGGLVFHGAFIFGLVSAVIYIKRNSLPFWKTLDILAVFVPLAHSFGRVGCFLNGCCYGKPTRVWWAVVSPAGEYVKVHPTQLYSAFFLFLLFLYLFFREGKKAFDGQIFFLYLALYGILRFIIEFFRGDNNPVLGILTIFQVISLGLVFCGICGYFILKKKSKK